MIGPSVTAEQRLVQQIRLDPGILGLGHLELQWARWCADQLGLLLQDRTESMVYVVEIQFGPTDDHHVIRAAERWATERKRQGATRCFPVLVAEEIPPRYRKILPLIRRAVPMLAMELRVSESAPPRFTPVPLR